MMFASAQAMGWAGLFVASAGTGVAGMLLCGLLGILYTLGFIVASAGDLIGSRTHPAILYTTFCRALLAQNIGRTEEGTIL